MDIWTWLLIAVLVLAPRRAGGDRAADRVRSVTLLLGLLCLLAQAVGV